MLSLLGVLGNALSIPLFFGVDVIFGSIASLIAIAWLGPRLGIVVTLISASYTYFLWNHFYAGFILCAEGVFVALLLHRLRGNLALAATLFWILIGIPLHAALYYYGLKMDWLGVELATIKQATSGIFNSIIASLILSYAPFLPTGFSRRGEKRIALYQHIFNIFVGATLVPAAILLVFDARSALKEIESSAMSRLETVSTGISQATEGYIQQQRAAILSVAWQIQESGNLQAKRTQELVDGVRHIWPDYYGCFVTDRNGKTIAFDPLKNKKGESTLGLDFSDRYYFQHFRDGGTGVYISDIYLARGAVFEPVFSVTAPIHIKNQFVGIVSGAIKVQNVIDKLHTLLKDSVFQATLVDRVGNVVVSDHPDYPPMSSYAPLKDRKIKHTIERYYYRTPDHVDTAPMSKWNKSVLGVSVDVDAVSGWKLYVEQPMAPMRTILYQRYIRNMAYLLSLALVILFGSMWIAGRISRPLAQLSNETTNLPRRLEQQEKINWPKSPILELDIVTENFKSMVTEFKNRFIELENSRNQLKLAKDEAEAANRMKSSFLANMSHEIRTPLGVMVGFAELMTDEDLDPIRRKEFASGLKRNAKQLSLLIDDILDLSKVEAGQLSLEFQDVCLRQMMKDIVADFALKAREKGLEVHLQISDEVPEGIISDSARLKQIMVNLIGNALKFTQRGRIDLVVHSDATHVRIEVVDQGLGISEEDQEKLFKPFSQADESLTRKFGGTGLGLALSRRLSRLLGGDLRLVRSQLGQGSTFQVMIPRRIEVSAQKRHHDRGMDTVPARAIKNAKILLVEDSEDNQTLITNLLERAGAHVDVAHNGLEGIQKATSGSYDVVLMDLQMPIMDGLTAARHLRAQGYKRPLIALTAHAMAEFRQKCLEAGFNGHVAKPIHFDELLSAITQVDDHEAPFS